jgi:chromosome transmission fidelity protein 18
MDFIKSGKTKKAVTEKAKTQILEKAEKKNNRMDIDDNDYEDRERDRENIPDADEKLDDEDDKKPTKAKNEIKRPIICICNDLYAKVLTVLRKEALVFHIKKASGGKLEKRLKEICQTEGLNVDTSTIKNLCNKSNNDIRTCINALEFISHNKANIPLLKTISGEKLNLLGRKDISEGIFDIWTKIFFSAEKRTYKYIADLYSSYGEYTRINEGIYVNYPKIGAFNSTTKEINLIELESRSTLLDYLSYDDTLTKKINANQHFELARFSCLPGLYASRKYTTKERPNLEFPIMLNDFRKTKKNNSKIFNSLKDSFNEESKNSKVSKRELVLDFLPFIFQIIQPSFREINITLMNKEEQRLIKRAVNIMCSFGIKFDNSQDEEDVAIYEPDIKKLLSFSYLLKEISYKLSTKQKVLLMAEHSKICSLKDIRREDSKAPDVKEGTAAVPDAKKPFQFNVRRTYTQAVGQESRFIYKFKEGVTNSVKRALNINYFS